jgi:hypothetical protein
LFLGSRRSWVQMICKWILQFHCWGFWGLALLHPQRWLLYFELFHILLNILIFPIANLFIFCMAMQLSILWFHPSDGRWS